GDDLFLDSPYNTYQVDGLPPGPIANPGYASIMAVLEPAETDYMYFVAKNDGSGEHAFAATKEEQDANVELYLNNQGRRVPGAGREQSAPSVASGGVKAEPRTAHSSVQPKHGREPGNSRSLSGRAKPAQSLLFAILAPHIDRILINSAIDGLGA